MAVLDDYLIDANLSLLDKTRIQAQIVAIEYIGNAGMARLEARNWRGTRYTDFFVLSKQDDNWRINSKVFYAHSRA